MCSATLQHPHLWAPHSDPPHKANCSRLLAGAYLPTSCYHAGPTGWRREGEGGRRWMGTLHPPHLEPRLTTGSVTLLRPALLWSRRAGTRGGEWRRQLCCGHGRSHHQETQPQRGRDEWWPKKEWEKLSVIHALNRRAISVQSSWKERLTRGSRGHAHARAGCLAGMCHSSAPK